MTSSPVNDLSEPSEPVPSTVPGLSEEERAQKARDEEVAAAIREREQAQAEAVAARQRAIEEAARQEELAAERARVDHQRRTDDIRRAKELARAREDELEARGAKLLADELETKVSADLAELAVRETNAREALAATDAEAAKVGAGLAAARLQQTAEINALAEKELSYRQVRAVIDAYAEQCLDCRQLMLEATGKERRAQSDAQSVEARLLTEIEERCVCVRACLRGVGGCPTQCLSTPPHACGHAWAPFLAPPRVSASEQPHRAQSLRSESMCPSVTTLLTTGAICMPTVMRDLRSNVPSRPAHRPRWTRWQANALPRTRRQCAHSSKRRV